MGCGKLRANVSERVLNKPIKLIMNITDIQRIDTQFEEVLNIMRKIEDLRRNFSFKWNRLSLSSGAIVIQKPSFKSIIDGILWKISSEIPSLKSSFSISLTNPFLDFNHQIEVSNELKEIQSSYSFFMDYFWEKNDIIDQLDNQIELKYSSLKEMLSTDMFTGIKITKESK